jgi:hypothetical protein
MRKIYTLALGLFSIALLSAQTGPGGVGNSTNNVIWLDGDIVTIASNPNIGTWPDQSGNGNNFTQSNTSKQPSRVTYYGHNALRFDGADFVRTGAIAALNATNHTQYIVYNGNQANHTGILFNSTFTQSNQFYRTYRSAGGNVQSWVLKNTGGTVNNSTTNNSAFQIISSHWNGTAQTWNSFKNGTSFGSQSGANGNPTGNSQSTVGASSSNSYRFNGDMGEVIIYNSVLNSAQRNIVDNYLSSKFKITIGSDMYTYDSGLSHQYQLIGVGQEADGNNLVAQGKGIVQITASGLTNGDYLFTGHDNAGLSQTTNDVPATISGGTRITRTWRVGVTGTPGTVDVDVDVSSLTLSAGAYYLVVESANGIFNDGGTVEYGPVADVGGIASFTGVSFADGDYYSIASSNGSAITSVKTGFWDVASTWSCNCVPGSTDDVTITNGHTVTARTTTNVNNIVIDGNLNTQSTGSFNVKGDYTVNATGTIVHKTITFNGTTSQQDITNNSVATVDFSTMVVNNTNNVTLQSGNFSISNSLNVSNGQLQNIGASCTLLSTASKTAVIVNGSGGFSGNFGIQRYISTRNANWSDLSSPVSNATLGSWDSDQTGTVTELFMSGVNGIDGSAGGFESVYRYDEVGQAYIAVTDTNYALTPGIGTEVWLGDDFTTWNAKAFDTHGTPNFGNIQVSLSNSFNLVGNPYQAFINWANLTKPTLNSTYYIWNTNTGSYDAKTTGQIPPHQGFWVESVGAGTLTFTESSKNGSGGSVFYKEDQEDVEFVEVKLKVRSDINRFTHELKLRLNNLASNDYDYYDASFLKSRIKEAPSITTFANNSNKELAINSFNYEEEVVLPVKVNVGVTGEYVIEPINFVDLSTNYQFMELKDLKTGITYDLTGYFREGITVDINEEDDSERFELRLSNLQGNVTSNEDELVNIYKSYENTVIEFSNIDGNYEVLVYNALGQKIMENINSNGENKIMISNNNFPKGMNIITVKSLNNISVKKLTY